MKTLLTLLFISVCSIAFGQKKTITTASSAGIIITDEVRLNQFGLDRKFELSKGELLTIQQHEEDFKRNGPAVRDFLRRDSIYRNQFLPNTISPYINQGDTLESWNKVGNEIHLKFKRHKP